MISVLARQGVVNPVIFDAECWIRDLRQLNQAKSVSITFCVTKSKANLAAAHPAKRPISELPAPTFPKAAPTFLALLHPHRRAGSPPASLEAAGAEPRRGAKPTAGLHRRLSPRSSGRGRLPEPDKPRPLSLGVVAAAADQAPEARRCLPPPLSPPSPAFSPAPAAARISGRKMAALIPLSQQVTGPARPCGASAWGGC